MLYTSAIKGIFYVSKYSASFTLLFCFKKIAYFFIGQEVDPDPLPSLVDWTPNVTCVRPSVPQFLISPKLRVGLNRTLHLNNIHTKLQLLSRKQ